MRVAPLMTLLAAATRGDVDAVARMDARLDALLKADPAWLGTFEADAYATDWARATDKRCAAANCSWAGGFGPIDVDCRLRVDAAGLEPDGPGPRATFEFHDKTTLTITAETAADEKRFVSRPALCEYVPESGDPGDAALLMVANSPSYLMRLWPQLLNKLLYATDASFYRRSSTTASSRRSPCPSCTRTGRTTWSWRARASRAGAGATPRGARRTILPTSRGSASTRATGGGTRGRRAILHV